MSKTENNLNGKPPYGELKNGHIVKAAIYPGIGIARLGNSDEYLIGPEVPDPLPLEKSKGKLSPYRDSEGRLLRQAARFRVYGLNAEGQIVKELTGDDNAEIKWTVHLANQKSAWYQFQLALDIPEAASAIPSLLRNPAVADRSQLVIDPGPRTITGKNKQPVTHEDKFNGQCMNNSIYLGELRTDEAGRLIVLGGLGKSASFDNTIAITFANNDGWYDDISDGPVTAEVTYHDKKLQVDSSWVVVAPPNYAPMQKSVRTMWDLMRDVAIQAKMLQRPPRPSFDEDIRPLFERMTRLQWVNAGFAAAFGWKGPNDFTTREWMERLASPDPTDQEMRRTIANQFRVFKRDAWSPIPWPWLYGDAMNIPPAETPRQNTSLTKTQLRFLQQWVEGDFDSDYDPDKQPPRKLDEVDIREQGDMLNRASLEYCLADAFHPGCEMTWPMRNKIMYMAPFRLRNAQLEWEESHPGKIWKEPHYGAEMTQDTLSLPNGPLAAQVPGGITRWMAIPWQTDTASCRSGYIKAYDPYLPTFWPARVPNQVLTEENFQIVMDETRSEEERLAAFASRATWLRILSPNGTETYTDQINNMIESFGEMGIVELRDGPTDEQGKKLFPDKLEVEQLPEQAKTSRPHFHEFAAKGSTIKGRTKMSEAVADEIDLTEIAKVKRFPYGLLRR